MSIKIPERFTVENANEVLAELVAAAEDSDSLRVDLSGVANVDTAGLQLLVVLKQGLENRGGTCEFDDVPDALVDRARLLGLDSLLELA